MRLERLELDHFRSHAHADIDLSAVDSASIIGPNGAGKSSLLVAIDYALFGGSPDELLSKDAKAGSVTLTIGDDRWWWQIKRGRERNKKSWLVIERSDDQGESWLALDTHTIADGQQIIVRDVIGMDGEAFRASVYSPQGQAGLLVSLSPRDRKALLGGLLGLDRYEEWREEAAADARGVKSEREAHDQTVQRLEGEIGSLLPVITAGEVTPRQLEAEDDLRELEEELDLANKRAAVSEQVRRRMSLVTQMKEMHERGKKIKARRKEREGVESQIKALEGVEPRLVELTAERDRHRAEQASIEAASQARRAAESRVERLSGVVDQRKASEEAQRALVEGYEPPEGPPPTDTCQTCGQEIAGEARDRAVAAYEAAEKERRERLQEALDAAVAVREGSEAELAEAEAELEQTPVPADFEPFPREQEWVELDAQVGALQGLRGRLEGLGDDEDLDALRARYNKMKVEAESLPESVPEGRAAEDVRAAIESVRTILQELATLKQRGEDAKQRVEALRAEQESARSWAEHAGKRERALGVVAKAFSRNGIPAMILDNAVGSIETAANEVLGELGVELSLRLLTQREKKGGGLTETLDVLVDDGSHERPVESYSGGEQYRVHIALRLALARTLGGGGLDFLLIDEPTDLDAAGVEALALLIASMPQQVLLVTHQEDLVASLPQQIVVGKDASGSLVAV